MLARILDSAAETKNKTMTYNYRARAIENTLTSMTLDTESCSRFANTLSQEIITRSAARVQHKIQLARYARNECRIAKIAKQLAS